MHVHVDATAAFKILTWLWSIILLKLYPLSMQDVDLSQASRDQ